ncbi:MAG: hypothetical protein HKM95_08220 [Inquilinus sp.]|nr:hypothetical protein [Inquilinus sp.]
MTRIEAEQIVGELRQGRFFAGPHSGKQWQVIPLPGGSFVQIGKAPDREEQAVISENEVIRFFEPFEFETAHALLR